LQLVGRNQVIYGSKQYGVELGEFQAALRGTLHPGELPILDGTCNGRGTWTFIVKSPFLTTTN
jgi:hypothetical protein